MNDALTAKNSVPTQSMTDTGTASFTASDIAEDMDSGDTLTIMSIVTSPVYKGNSELNKRNSHSDRSIFQMDLSH